MSIMKRFGGLSLLVAAILLVAAPGAMAQGLKLDTTKEKVVQEGDVPNPHNELECTDCHLEKPAEEPGKGDKTKVAFVDNAMEDKLCFNCHDTSSNVHPVKIDPTVADPPVAIPKLFPLGYIGEDTGKIVCTTCHFIHSEFSGFKMLRGFPMKQGDKGFTDRRQFCKACHGENLSKKSPHLGTKTGDKGCSFCHATMPKEGEKATFKSGIADLCNFCHAATAGAHYLKVNPFADPTLKAEMAKLTLPMDGGQFTCTTCHEPHGNKKPKFVRQEYEDFAVKSRRIRPHFQQVFCRTCHKKDPVDGGKLKDFPLLLEDPTALCNRCHGDPTFAVGDVHPLPVVKAKWDGKVPADFPLYKGKLTCLTCHTAGDKQTAYDPANPSFLRGAPYAARNDPCWKCHDRAAFAKLDPHQDIQTGEGCAFCHSKAPDTSKKLDIEQLDFKGDMNMLCLRCHDATPHPAGADHTGVPGEKWAKLIPKTYPRDKQGRMTCATCHNPHVSGGSKTRGMAVGLEICPECHKR
jgi:predicted CXXCH cytochrome family protein